MISMNRKRTNPTSVKNRQLSSAFCLLVSLLTVFSQPAFSQISSDWTVEISGQGVNDLRNTDVNGTTQPTAYYYNQYTGDFNWQNWQMNEYVNYGSDGWLPNAVFNHASDQISLSGRDINDTATLGHIAGSATVTMEWTNTSISPPSSINISLFSRVASRFSYSLTSLGIPYANQTSYLNYISKVNTPGAYCYLDNGFGDPLTIVENENTYLIKEGTHSIPLTSYTTNASGRRVFTYTIPSIEGHSALSWSNDNQGVEAISHQVDCIVQVNSIS